MQHLTLSGTCSLRTERRAASAAVKKKQGAEEVERERVCVCVVALCLAGYALFFVWLLCSCCDSLVVWIASEDQVPPARQRPHSLGQRLVRFAAHNDGILLSCIFFFWGGVEEADKVVCLKLEGKAPRTDHEQASVA